MTPSQTTTLSEARDMLLSRARCVTRPAEELAVMQSLGRIAAADYHSAVNLPQTDNAAVDGYAVQSVRLGSEHDRRFRIAGTARAGHPFSGAVSDGEALEIYTGAVVPPGPDCIVMHEDCTVADGHVICRKIISAGTNIRPAGENLRSGETVLESGSHIGPAEMGQLAAAGIEHILVQPRLSVRLLSTGDELVTTGTVPAAGQIPDSNRPMLAGLVQAQGLCLSDGGIIEDKKDRLIAAYERGLNECDAVISTGGASDGIEDHTQAALRAVGAEPVFWRLAMKPGRPMAVGQKGGKFIFCLPGNPVAAFVCFKLLVMPVINRMGGGKEQQALAIRIASGFQHNKQPGRAEYLRARLIMDENTGQQQAVLHGRKGAGVISSLTGADGLVEIPMEARSVSRGEMLNFLPFRERAL